MNEHLITMLRVWLGEWERNEQRYLQYTPMFVARTRALLQRARASDEYPSASETDAVDEYLAAPCRFEEASDIVQHACHLSSISGASLRDVTDALTSMLQSSTMIRTASEIRRDFRRLLPWHKRVWCRVCDVVDSVRSISADTWVKLIVIWFAIAIVALSVLSLTCVQ